MLSLEKTHWDMLFKYEYESAFYSAEKGRSFRLNENIIALKQVIGD
jgi:hypothetical protein